MISENLAQFFQSQGHEVIVVCGAYSTVAFSGPDTHKLDIYRIPSWTFPKTRFSFNFDINFCLKPGNKRRVADVLDEFNPDVVHIHGQFLDLSWKALSWCRRRAVPSVLTLHTRLNNPNWLINLFFWILDKYLVALILRRNPPTRVISIDSKFDTYIEKRYKAIAANRLNIPVGVNLTQFLVAETRKSRVNTVPVIGSIGHIIATRNRRTLLYSIAMLQKRYPGISVVLCGNDYLSSSIDSLIRRLGIEDFVLKKGPVAHHDIPKLLDEFDLEIHDLDGIGYNLATIESMARGVPTIISTPRDYYQHALLEDGKHSLIVKPENVDDLCEKIVLLLEDVELYKTISRGGNSFAKENFDLKKVGIAYLKLFSDISAKS